MAFKKKRTTFKKKYGKKKFGFKKRMSKPSRAGKAL